MIELLMTPSVPTDYTGATEDAVREEVLEGLGRAVNEAIEKEKQRALSKTEEEKLMYFAVTEFDLPVTYSWYLAGAKASADGGSANPFISPGTTQDPTGIPESIEEYKMYFLETTFFADYTLKDVIYTDKTEFLCDFYEHECSEKYKDLYIASAKFRRKLERAVNKAEDRIGSGERTTGEITPILSSEKERDIKDLLTTIQIELLQIDELSHCREVFKNGVGEIEAAITRLSNTHTVTAEQHELLQELEDYYYDAVWKYPALKISAETVTGPAAPEVRRHRLNRFETFEEEILAGETGKIEEIRGKRRSSGLVANMSGFEESNDSPVMQEAYLKIAEQAGGD